MSGIDQYTRFYWTVDQDGNSAQSALEITSGEAQWEYNWDTGEYDIYDSGNLFPVLTSRFYDESLGYTSAGKFSGELGFHAYSYLPSDGVNPSRPPSYQLATDVYGGTAGFSGFSGLMYGDYTIDFWFKINPVAAGSGEIQTILSNSNNGWMLYYDNGEIGQIQGTNHHVSCVVDLGDDLFHHVEFNRNVVSGEYVNRIFIDGIQKTLNNNLWFPTFSLSDLESWIFGCASLDYRGMDFVLDELRFSTAIARHTSNFSVPTAHYTVEFPPIEISSPVDGRIEFIPDLTLDYQIEPKFRVPAVTDYAIRIEGYFSQELTLDEDPYILATTNGRIRFESSLDMVVHLYGQTVPPVTDGVVEFDAALVMECSLDAPITIAVIEEGTLYDLIENVLQLPMTLEVDVMLDMGTWNLPECSINLLNSLIEEFGLILLNALNMDVETSINFYNNMTQSLTVTTNFRNKVLSVNETEKELKLLNRLDGSGSSEVYEGFYFSKIHGV